MAEKNHRVLENAIRILELVSKNSGLTLTDICNTLKIPKSSAYVLLNTFVNVRYMKKDKKTGLYTIDIGVFELGTRFTDNNEFYRNAREILENIVSKVDETAHLAVLEDTNAVYVCKHESSKTVRMVSSVGKRLPAHASAIGKALLSGYTDKQIRAMYDGKTLERFTKHTVTDIEKLLEQINRVRQEGVAFESEESTPGVECIAVPIKSRFSGCIEAAVSISVPTIRSRGNLEQYKEILSKAKKSLETFI